MGVQDPAGIPIEKPRSGRIDERLQAEDKNWQPKFLASFAIPPHAPGGKYKIPVKVRDELAGVETERTLEFQVRGPALETESDMLVIRGFRFLREEEDGTPLRPAAYHPGSMLWARFEITGYKFGGNNAFSVDYGLAVLGADGKQLFAQPEAASESKASFYPQRTVPGVLSLSLDKNVPTAAYTLVVTVRDKVGNVTVETREPFTVE
jgi:hypothetical protein